jgi:hypothetical protein
LATPFVLKDAKIYVDGYDVSGSSNQVSITHEYTEVPIKVFGADVHYALPGKPKFSLEYAGLACSDGTDEVEDVLEAKYGTANVPVSVGPTGADVTPGYFTKVINLGRQLGGNIGDPYGFQASGVSQGFKLVRGYYLAPRVSRTSSTTGTVKQISAVTAAQKVYSLLHIFAVSGTSPTLDVIVESDDAAGFVSGATRVTHAQATTIGSQLLTADGAITDDYWRVSWTIGGSDTPTFDFAVLVGII